MATSGRPFPEDLAEKILVSLPVESLLRFECACKNWYKIIKNPDFIRKHLNINCNKSPQILVYDHTAADDTPPITLISDGGVLENPPHYFRGMTYLLGSVDGLFLLERIIDGNIYNIWLALWNPATREVRPLPEPNFELQPDLFQVKSHFGFGLAPVTNDYKVVWFRHFASRFPPYAAVYSCSRDSWRILQLDHYYENLIYVYCIRDALGTAYLNGAYYWLVLAAPYTKCRILSFDFANEVFGEIEGPDAGRPFSHTELYLILLDDDSIALLSSVSIFGYEIWVMIQPGLWNKLFTFQCFTLSPFIMSWNPSTVIYVTRRSRLVSYDVKTGETRRLGFRHLGLWRAGRTIAKNGCSVHIYKKSFVTIKRGNEEPHLT